LGGLRIGPTNSWTLQIVRATALRKVVPACLGRRGSLVRIQSPRPIRSLRSRLARRGVFPLASAHADTVPIQSPRPLSEFRGYTGVTAALPPGSPGTQASRIPGVDRVARFPHGCPSFIGVCEVRFAWSDQGCPTPVERHATRSETVRLPPTPVRHY
jgi:hypothetical protein